LTPDVESIFLLMPITSDEVRHIARLARLNLSPQEVVRFSQELSVVVDYIGQLETVDTDGIEPQNQFIKAENVFRADEVHPSLSRQEALANAPQTDGTYFQVPKVIG
jgi:aspartyl-tRNA(Asn)/glutamyl-tRNA(Gln) amidotransferase subunit C